MNRINFQNENKININNVKLDKGIIQRSIDFIFERIKNKENFTEKFSDANENKYEYIIKASFMEIYNEEVFDLLNIKTPPKHIIIRDINNITSVSGVSSINVLDLEDCYK